MSESTTPYIHGTSPDEQSRLALMNRILNQRELVELGLTGDERVLEMGAGTGVFATDLARAVPHGNVVAVERDERQLALGRENVKGLANLDLRGGDAYDPPLTEEEWGTFDLVHARFLLEHLERPLEAVRLMVRAVRPGGRIALIDDDHSLMRLWPEPAGFHELWGAYVDQYVELGTDPFIGRRLVALLQAAGARPVRTSMVFYGGCSNDPGFAPVVENLARVVDGARARVVSSGALTGERFDQSLRELERWVEGPDRALWYGLPLAEGTR